MWSEQERERLSNEIIKERCGWKRGLVSRCQQGILKWYGHLIRMEDERLVKKVFESSVAGRRKRGKPKQRWLDGVEGLLKRRGIGLCTGKKWARDRKAWKRKVWGMS